MSQRCGSSEALGLLAADVASAALALARSFAAEATLWCWAPLASEHAQHVAVEFVHPVIIGKRALPAVSIDSVDIVGALRTLVDPGDVVLAIGTADDAAIRNTLRRATAWGAMSVWIGAGPRPPRGAADHVLWVDDDPAEAMNDGRLMLQYHVLWELAHVCLEHPGLLAEPTEACSVADGGICVTCSDEGHLGEVIAVHDSTARVRTADGQEDVDTTIIDTVRPGDLILIHARTAIAMVDDG